MSDLDYALRIAREGGGPIKPHIKKPHVHKFHVGPIHSSVAGRTDHLPITVESGSYVIPADIISAFGEGNTIAGFKHARRVFGGMPRGQGQQPYNHTGGPYGEGSAPYRQGAIPYGMADGGKVADDDADIREVRDNPKRLLIKATGPGGVKGIVVPKHMWLPSKQSPGMKAINEARAKVYGGENRDPLNIREVGEIHRATLQEHFQKPLPQQLADEDAALNRLRAAKHIAKDANTLDESEKLDTVRHERDAQGRGFVAYGSKGTAGHSVYSSGTGANERLHVINTCPGQTAGCSGGVDKNGIVDTKRGTCFAPNTESQYSAVAVRRAAHEQAKHDPKMTRDWILAHTGSLRRAAQAADKKNLVTLFRPNMVDESDTTSRDVVRHLNEQRRANGLPNIIGNSYGKTNELHDPENGWYITHSNVGPKVKRGTEVRDNIGRDAQRIRSTITAADNHGDFKNEHGALTPPKNSYLVTDVPRYSDLDKRMQASIKYAKYWSAGRDRLSDAEKEEGPEGHFDERGKPTTPEMAHYGHTTLNGRRYDYQKQHILHPRLVQVGQNDDGSPHMIATDSRFLDNNFLPKHRYVTKNGKQAGAILMTTPTTSTSGLQHETAFTHHVDEHDIGHAQHNNGEYEIDAPAKQEAARGKPFVEPRPIKFYAGGGSVFSDDPMSTSAFPEQSFTAQAHNAHHYEQTARPPAPVGTPTNPIDPNASTHEKLNQIHALTHENLPKLHALVAAINREVHGAHAPELGPQNIKTDESILGKVTRPEVLKKKPWFGVEHLADTLRFKTHISHSSQLPLLVDALKKHGVDIAKIDAEKFLKPNDYGWRMLPLDLKMPNGQLVEHYAVGHHMAHYSDREGHLLYEKWRGADKDKLSEAQLAEYYKDLETSNTANAAAWHKDFGQEPESALRASVDKAVARAGSSTRTRVLSHGAWIGDENLPQTPSRLAAQKPSLPSTSGSDPSRSVVTWSAIPTSNAPSIPEDGRPPKADGGAASGVPIVAAGGEYVLSPEQVRGVGNGDLDTGHRVLDRFVKDTRAQLIKTLQKLPGPKKD